MQKQHANIDFHGVTQSELSPLAATIVTDMTANTAVYPTPTVPLATVNLQLTSWNTILGKPDYPGKTGDLKNARIALETSLKQNGIYVNSIAKGDLAMLAKSGYPISKLHSPVGDLLPPDSVTVTNGTSPSTFDVAIAVVDNAKGYLFANAPISNAVSDPNLWTIKWSAKHTNTFSGFATGTQYKFAACAVGSSNNVFWTNAPSNLFAQ